MIMNRCTMVFGKKQQNIFLMLSPWFYTTINLQLKPWYLNWNHETCIIDSFCIDISNPVGVKEMSGLVKCSWCNLWYRVALSTPVINLPCLILPNKAHIHVLSVFWSELLGWDSCQCCKRLQLMEGQMCAQSQSTNTTWTRSVIWQKVVSNKGRDKQWSCD